MLSSYTSLIWQVKYTRAALTLTDSTLLVQSEQTDMLCALVSAGLQQTLLGLMHHELRFFLLPFQPMALAPGCRRLRRLPFWLPRDLDFLFQHILVCNAESLSTLKFANRAKNIRNAARVNEDVDQRTLLRKYERELRRLRAELQQRQRELVDKRHLLEVCLLHHSCSDLLPG